MVQRFFTFIKGLQRTCVSQRFASTAARWISPYQKKSWNQMILIDMSCMASSWISKQAARWSGINRLWSRGPSVLIWTTSSMRRNGIHHIALAWSVEQRLLQVAWGDKAIWDKAIWDSRSDSDHLRAMTGETMSLQGKRSRIAVFAIDQ